MTVTRLDDIELFLVALIQRGLSTPYDLKSRAGLSVGSTAPVLARIEKNGWIRAGKPGVRRVRRFTVTKAGAKKLTAEWRKILRRRTTSIDEILRIVFLAWTMGGGSEVSRFIDQAVEDMTSLADLRKAQSAQLESLVSSQPGGEAYQWLKLCTQVAELEADATMLRDLQREMDIREKRKKKI